jgi:hypothetical protein
MLALFCGLAIGASYGLDLITARLGKQLAPATSKMLEQLSRSLSSVVHVLPSALSWWAIKENATSIDLARSPLHLSSITQLGPRTTHAVKPVRDLHWPSHASTSVAVYAADHEPQGKDAACACKGKQAHKQKSKRRRSIQGKDPIAPTIHLPGADLSYYLRPLLLGAAHLPSLDNVSASLRATFDDAHVPWSRLHLRTQRKLVADALAHLRHQASNATVYRHALASVDDYAQHLIPRARKGFKRAKGQVAGNSRVQRALTRLEKGARRVREQAARRKWRRCASDAVSAEKRSRAARRVKQQAKRAARGMRLSTAQSRKRLRELVSTARHKSRKGARKVRKQAGKLKQAARKAARL